MGIELEGSTCEYPCGHTLEFHKHGQIPCLLCHVLDRKDGCAGFKPMHCADCGEKDVRSRDDLYEFQYGNGPDMAKLSCVHPVRRCAKCGFEFLDWEAEETHSRAVAFHLLAVEIKKQQAAKVSKG